ncbi:MAG: tRNA 2-thiocytidine biosynthesis protein TtcA [Angelakisella sp.]|jgi:tRNA 2-thiocytidine biosynthesis protein TtcA|nr:tRNA 2-thiocytidine biosynthesis protein TtcA [Angelakisella sp.]
MPNRPPLSPCQQIERSLITKYRKTIWNRFIGGIKDYALIQKGDRIAVCISGGKDSMLLAKCMQQLHRHSEIPFHLEFLVMDPGYRPANRELILRNAALMEIPIHLFESQIFDVVADIPKSPCYLCARMRRGYLYSHAQKLGCNKIALGHHFDDVVETILMSTLYGAEYRTMMPKLHSTNFPGMELIRPLYLVRERDIIAWKHYNHLSFLQCACRFTEALGREDEPGESKRQEVKELIAALRRDNPQVDINIFRSVHSVNLDTVIGWRSAAEGEHSFLEKYD